MALKIKFVILLLVLSLKVFSEEELPVLFAKQPAAYVRFISKDGTYTYYLTRSGSLMVSTNYQSAEVIKGVPGTNYLVSSSPSRKVLLFTMDQNYLDFMSQREANTIYKMSFGKKDAVKIGYGLDPKLHLEDNWASYFNIQENAINFQNLTSEALQFKIKINNLINPYFIPQVVMLNKETVLFTDLSQTGVPAITIFSRADKKSKLIFKGTSQFEKIEICLKNDFLIVGHFGFDKSTNGSSIDLIPIKELQEFNKTNIYQSAKNDIGNLVCDFEKDTIYFIKNYSTNINQVYEVASLNINNKEEKKLTSILNATQILSMDDKLLLSAFGKTYVLAGRSDYQKDFFQKEPEKKKVKK